MLKKIFLGIISVVGLLSCPGNTGFLFSIVPHIYAAECGENDIKLNTKIPFIGDCIRKETTTTSDNTNVSNAFPKLMGGLTRLMMSVILVGSFLAILVAGLMMASSGFTDKYSAGKDLIIKVIAGLALIGVSGAILNAINPNFFKTQGFIQHHAMNV